MRKNAKKFLKGLKIDAEKEIPPGRDVPRLWVETVVNTKATLDEGQQYLVTQALKRIIDYDPHQVMTIATFINSCG